MKTASASPGARLAPRLPLIICGQELWQILCGVSQGQIVSVLMIELAARAPAGHQTFAPGYR